MLLCKVYPGGQHLQQPKALVLVLGHLGCTQSQLVSYMDLFTPPPTTTSTTTTTGSQEQPLPPITVGVIGTVSPVKNFLFHQSLRTRAMEVLQETIHFIRFYEQQEEQKEQQRHDKQQPVKQTTTPATIHQIPILVHAMSNGGAFLLEEIEKILVRHTQKQQQEGEQQEQEQQGKKHQKEQQQQQQLDDESLIQLSTNDCHLILERMKKGVQIFDSCPCYIRTFYRNNKNNNNNTTNLPISVVVQQQQQQQQQVLLPSFFNAFPQLFGGIQMIRSFYTTMATVSLSLWCWSYPNRSYEFWDHRMNSIICPHQVYIYSTKDYVSDSNAIDELIQYRLHQKQEEQKQQEQQEQQHTNNSTNNNDTNNCTITVLKYHDSGHCRLHMDHEIEYKQILQVAIEQSVQRMETLK